MYRRQVIHQREDFITAETRTIPLQPNPLSHIAITTIYEIPASFDPWRFNQAIATDLLQVTLRTQRDTIIQLRGDDLALLNAHKWSFTNSSPHRGGDNVAARSAWTLLLPLGRKLYDPLECLPQKPPGHNELTLAFSAAPAGTTARFLEVEAIYLPGATPRHHLKYEAQTLPLTQVTTNNDILLPRGNTILGILLFQEFVGQAAGTLGTIERVTILADHNEHQVINADWFAIWAETRHRNSINLLNEIEVVENTAAAYTQDATSREIRWSAGAAPNLTPQYAYLDLDPTNDQTHAINTTEFKETLLRINSGAAGIARIVPLQLVPA